MALNKERNHKVIDTLATAAFLGTVTFGIHNMKSLQGTANSNSELAANDQNTHKQHIISNISSNKKHKSTSTNNKKTDKNKDKNLSNLLASAASDVSKGSSKSAAIAKAADQAVNGNGDLLKQVASNTAKNKNNNPNLDKLENHVIKDNLPNTPTQHNDNDSLKSLESAVANSVTPKEPSSKAVIPNNHVTPSASASSQHNITPPKSTVPVTPTPTPSASVTPTPTPTPTPSSSATPTPTPSSSASKPSGGGTVTPSHTSSSTPSQGGNSQASSDSNSSTPTPQPSRPANSITSVPHDGDYSVTINFVDSEGNMIAKSLPFNTTINTNQKINEALANNVNTQLQALGLNNFYEVAANNLPDYVVQEKNGTLTYTVPLADKSVPNTTGNGTIQGGNSNVTTPAQPNVQTPQVDSNASTTTITPGDVTNNNTPTPVTPQADTASAITAMHSLNTAGLDLQ